MTAQDEEELNETADEVKEETPVNETEAAPEESKEKSEKKDKNKDNKKVKQLEADLDAAQKEIHKRDDLLVEAQNKLNRLLGEFDNLKKRTAKEKESVHDDTVGEVMTALLPVIDALEIAASVEASPEAMKGIVMTLNAFKTIMETYHVAPIGEVGEEFNPDFHNAVAHIENEDMKENVIAMVFRKGYKVGDKVIRPAMVQVAN